MQITYHFANEDVSINVSEEWGAILLELARKEYNANRKETRRHTSLDGMVFEGKTLEAGADVLRDVLHQMDLIALQEAVASLPAEQRELVHEVFFDGRAVAEVARARGVTPQAVYGRLRRIYEGLKIYF